MTWLLHKPDSFGHDRYRMCSYQLPIGARTRYRTTHNGGQPSIGRRMPSARSTCQRNPGAHRACNHPVICPFCSAPHCFPNTGKNNQRSRKSSRSGSRHTNCYLTRCRTVDMDIQHNSTTPTAKQNCNNHPQTRESQTRSNGANSRGKNAFSDVPGAKGRQIRIASDW